MGARLQRILFAQLQIQQRYFHVPVQVFRPWLEATGQGRPAKELITLYLMANTWKGWREQVLNKPAAGAKSRSAELLRRHADMLVDSCRLSCCPQALTMLSGWQGCPACECTE
jgi:hypothetical protein